VVTDAGGAAYLLLDSAEGHGTNAWTDYLVAYRLTDQLTERARLEMSEAAGPTSRWRYSYRIDTPPSGGLVLRLQLTVDGNAEIDALPLEKSKVVHIEP